MFCSKSGPESEEHLSRQPAKRDEFDNSGGIIATSGETSQKKVGFAGVLAAWDGIKITTPPESSFSQAKTVFFSAFPRQHMATLHRKHLPNVNLRGKSFKRQS